MDKRIREGIEACRPGSDDLLDSDLADTAEAIRQDADAELTRQRVQKWDVAIGASLEQIPVPADLAQRILTRLEAQSESPLGGLSQSLLNNVVSAAHEATPVESGTVDLAAPRSIWQRRHWAGASLSVIAAAVLVVVVGYWLQWGSDLPLDQLAAHWHDELTNKWQPAKTSPRNFPVPGAVRVPPSRWQWIGRIRQRR